MENKFEKAASDLGYVYGFGVTGAILISVSGIVADMGIVLCVAGWLFILLSAVFQVCCLLNFLSGFGDILTVIKNTSDIMLQFNKNIKDVSLKLKDINDDIYARTGQIVNTTAEVNKSICATNDMMAQYYQYMCDNVDKITKNS